jgi:CRISPR/Cas system-associated protein Csm6
MKCIVTTVGTSLFTNHIKDSRFIEADYEEIKDAPHSKWDELQARIQSIRIDKDFTRWISSNLANSCAEISSLMKIIESQQDDVEVRLLATDTVLSRLAAELIMQQSMLHPGRGKTVSLKFEPKKDVISGFNVDDAKVFETVGLHTFIKRFIGLQKQYVSLILNITGGYKGLIPYLTILGQINRVPVKYKFEESDALISIPQLPVNFDWELAVEYGDQVSGDLARLTEDVKSELIENNIIDLNGRLTTLGKIFKAYAETLDRNNTVKRGLRGGCAEARWFEYYVEKYPERKVRRSVGNGQEIEGKKLQKEADIVVEGDDTIIVSESKPIRYIYNYLENQDTQIEDLLRDLKNNEIKIHEFHLCIYSTGNEQVEQFAKHAAIASIRSLVDKYYSDSKFVLCLMHNVRELQSFMEMSLSSIINKIQLSTIPAT